MRSTILTLTALAALVAPAGALAQIGESDIPDLPASGSATFKVSLYGVQRFESVSSRQEKPGPGAFDERGTTESRSEVKFHTKQPARAVISRKAGYVSLRWLTKRDVPLPVSATFVHSGKDERETTNLTADEWSRIPPPEAKNCEATLELGFGLSVSGKRLEATQASDLVVPLDPFNGCPWGDRSMGLYTAKGKLPYGELLESPETRIVLRGREKSDAKGELYTSSLRKQTTVYVTFKKVG